MIRLLIEIALGICFFALLCEILHQLFLLTQKIEKLMSQTDTLNDLLAKLGTDITGISADVSGIATTITDLKNQLANGLDLSSAIATLTDLESRAAAAKTALDGLIPAPPTTEPNS